ncbi:hypothetical protein [Aquimarina longa]|uniref:hypothetical protein n=1 Tax=Aquimarina longa TaxID=1080221 RepID=UPI000784F453|nr:hypothetical protein [Aquimarina longa]
MKIKLIICYRFILLCFLGIILSCTTEKKTNKEEEENKILQLHHLQKEYHFKKLAKEFASQMSTGFISVNRGEIKKPTKGDNIKKYDTYFNSVTFEKWDDISPPIIRFSDEYTMAYTVVHKVINQVKL